VRAQADAGRALVGFTAPSGDFFAVGLGHERSCLMYWASAERPYLQIRGIDQGKPLDFAYDGQHTEVPATSLIIRDAALRALTEFVETGHRPERGLGRDLTSPRQSGSRHESALVPGELRQDKDVTGVRPAANAGPAQWLLRRDLDWWDLVRYGPPGFDVYVRIALADDADGADREGEEPALRAALATLVGHTTTPASGYAAIWEGWTSPAPRAPRVAIPNRVMLLFAGPVDELRDAPALAWYGSAQGVYQEPHLVWPEDRAWCLACEVDEEIEFTVGCSVGASEALARALPGTVRRVLYGESAPMYRD
jgi:hypothetical protein